jgi:hypothetical protein
VVLAGPRFLVVESSDRNRSVVCVDGRVPDFSFKYGTGRSMSMVSRLAVPV